MKKIWNLPFPYLLALRYLRTTRRDAFVGILSSLAALGIAVGAMALIIVLAALSGLQSFLRSDVLERTPHLEIELPEGADAATVREELLAIDGVRDARVLLRGRGWLIQGGRAIDTQLIGFEGAPPKFFSLEDSERASAQEEEPGAWIGDLLSRRQGIYVGDVIEIVSPRPTLTPFGPQPRARRVRVAGIYRTGNTEQDHRIGLPLDTTRRLLGGAAMRLEARADDLDAALALAPRLSQAVPEGSRLKTWKEINKGLFFALKLERTLMFLAVFLIVPVAAMSLVTAEALLISSKRGEIGMLQAMGAEAGELRRAFLAFGVLLSGVGLLLGTALGIGGAFALDRIGLRPPGDVYFVQQLPFLVRPIDVFAVVAATAVLTLASTFWAARRAARIPVVDALRR